MIAITRWEFRQPREALRVVSVAMEAPPFGSQRSPEAFHGGLRWKVDEDGIPVVVLTKKSPFTQEEETQ